MLNGLTAPEENKCSFSDGASHKKSKNGGKTPALDLIQKFDLSTTGEYARSYNLSIIELRYTRHALKRMKCRNITKRLVQEALIHGQKREQQEDKIKCSYIKGKDKLVIIYKQQKEIYKIITAYYEDRI